MPGVHMHGHSLWVYFLYDERREKKRGGTGGAGGAGGDRVRLP